MGVQIDMVIRGICCLRPGVKGVSENIRVISVVGRFLEHSRIYYFENGGQPELYTGSADLMPRNLDRRVEILFPIESPKMKAEILNNILEIQLNDTARGHALQSDGTYRLTSELIEDGEMPFNSQMWFLESREM